MKSREAEAIRVYGNTDSAVFLHLVAGKLWDLTYFLAYHQAASLILHSSALRSVRDGV
jgi:hypothetical protein